MIASVRELARSREGASFVASTILVASALALKACYAQAAVGELRFVLAPSCWLAGLLGGLRFVWEPARGFVAYDARLVVGVPCAGLNFLVACWPALFFCGQAALPDLRKKLAWSVASLGLAYLASVLANGTRIALAAQLGLADIYAGGVTHERVHRLVGVVVYSIALLGVCRGVTPFFGGDADARGGTRRPYLVPLGCYAAVAVVLPLCRRAFGAGAPGFGEHAAHTLVAAGAVAGCLWLWDRLSERLRLRLFSQHARS